MLLVRLRFAMRFHMFRAASSKQLQELWKEVP